MAIEASRADGQRRKEEQRSPGHMEPHIRPPEARHKRLLSEHAGGLLARGRLHEPFLLRTAPRNAAWHARVAKTCDLHPFLVPQRGLVSDSIAADYQVLGDESAVSKPDFGRRDRQPFHATRTESAFRASIGPALTCQALRSSAEPIPS